MPPCLSCSLTPGQYLFPTSGLTHVLGEPRKQHPSGLNLRAPSSGGSLILTRRCNYLYWLHHTNTKSLFVQSIPKERLGRCCIVSPTVLRRRVPSSTRHPSLCFGNAGTVPMTRRCCTNCGASTKKNGPIMHHLPAVTCKQPLNEYLLMSPGKALVSGDTFILWGHTSFGGMSPCRKAT